MRVWKTGYSEAYTKSRSPIGQINMYTVRDGIFVACSCNSAEPVFLNVHGAPESIPRNEFRQPM